MAVFMINLISKDKNVIEIDSESAKMSTILKNKVKTLELETTDKQTFVIIPQFDGAALKKIIEWMKHKKDNPPLVGGKIHDLSDWDREFLNVETVEFMALLRVAEALRVDSLKNAASIFVANRLMGKSKDGMIREFDVNLDDEEVKKKVELT